MLATCTVAFALGLSAFACSGGGDSSTNGRDPGDPGPGGGFVSDDPSGAGAAPGGPGTGTGGAGGAGGTGGNGGSSGSGNAGSGGGAGDPNRAIEEADIIQVDADRLYALSRYGGLSVIDAARPEQLRMLGRYRTEATPFEMYVKNNVVMGLFNEWGKYVSGAEGWQWVQSSRIAALDTSDPANIDSLGEFTVAGMISDSRIVGNILYVVSRQDGYCYECPANQPRTVILSLDVSNPSAVKKVDELVYDDVNDQWGWGTRSITVTDKRMYVGGREWGGDTGGGSTIQVIDISNPNGDMVPGAKVEAEGQIASRWQMDEYEGTLRVLSQPWQGFSEPPVLQTYRVESAQSVVPLARMPLVLPRPEQLQSTRFDGTRAYAITFQRTDPLFTIDLTNPASPRQMGELEMPGFVYHMEPRGDRLYGLGFDQNNPEGALNVSVFDVSNLAAPKLLDRVNFGSNWGYLPEDQDRIHKAFRLLDQQGMIVVPFSGYTYSSSSYGCGSYTSGVQLVDFTRDDLVLRGRAPSFGQARRAFVHRDRLFTVSDDRVQSFDIANRDAPAALHQVSLARQVNTTAVAGGQLVRLGAEWYTNKAQIDVTPLDNADAPNGIGSLDLESILGKSCGSGFHGARVLGNGNRVYVVYEDYVYESPTPQKTAIAVIDVSNPGSPRLEAHAPINSAVYYGWGGWGYNSVISSGEQLVQLGSTLVFVHGTPTYSERGYVVHDASLVVVDLSQPKSPRTTRLPLPNAQGLTGLHVDGSTILTSHFEPVAGSQGRVRFYVDRIDVSNPATPRLAGKVNVPGSLFAWEPVSRRAITVDYRRTVEQNVTAEACYAKGGYSRVTWQPYNTVNYYPNALGSCGVVHHSLRQVRIEGDSAASEGSWDVPQEYDLGRADVGAERVYIGLNQNYYSGGYVDGCYSGSCSQRSAKLLVLSGLTTGTMQTGTVSLTAEPWGGYIYHLAAFGDRALVAANSASELLVVDASTPTQPKTVRTVDTLGYVSDLQKHGDLAIIASGYDGAQIVDVRK